MPRKKAAKKKTPRKQKPKPRETATTKWVSFRLPVVSKNSNGAEGRILEGLLDTRGE